MADRPNLLYIHSDQHSAFVTGCYGDPLVQTPHLDGLAAPGGSSRRRLLPVADLRSVAHVDAERPAPVRKPGMDQQSHPELRNSDVRARHGCCRNRPVLVGRMHSKGPDQLHGYADRLVGDHGPNQAGGDGGGDRGELQGCAGPARVSLTNSGSGQSSYQVHDEDVTAATVDYLNRLGVRKRSGVGYEPFSVSVGFMLPHQPFVARREDYDLYDGKMTMPRTPQPFTDDLHPHIAQWRRATDTVEVSDEEILRCRTAYWALVTRMDAMVGEILEALRRNELADNTLIVYTSDHGEQVGEHGLWWKQTFYEDSVRVPAILSWPGHLPAGERCDRVVSSLDLNATMVDALGAPPLPQSRGRSLLKLLRDRDADWDDLAFSEFCQDAAGGGGPFPEHGVFQRKRSVPMQRGAWRCVGRVYRVTELACGRSEGAGWL